MSVTTSSSSATYSTTTGDYYYYYVPRYTSASGAYIDYDNITITTGSGFYGTWPVDKAFGFRDSRRDEETDIDEEAWSDFMDGEFE